jgi:hypothetical protein
MSTQVRLKDLGASQVLLQIVQQVESLFYFQVNVIDGLATLVSCICLTQKVAAIVFL